jgi:23S rRNA (guanosine2251-2'-O)-methyltransferase
MTSKNKSFKESNFEYLYGLHSVKAAFLNPHRSFYRLFILKDTLKKHPFLKELALNLKSPPEVVSESELFQFIPKSAVHQGVVLETAPLPSLELEDFLPSCPENALVLVLDQVTDPHNFGAIIRSAAAFGASALITTSRHSPSLQGIVARATAGGIEHVPLIFISNLRQGLKTLKNNRFWCYGLAEEGKDSIENSKLSGRIALVLGSEGSGLRRLTMEDCDVLVHLPTVSSFSTLNVSNAAAIALYEAKRQLNIK